jgi:serine/threonine protein kinase
MVTHVGERWGNYQLVQFLGQGGFAEVYLGEHVRLGMRAAIKILHSRLTGNDIADFQREARTIAELAHPHIIRVLDFDVQQGVPFLVLEYAPNGSLRQKHPYRERVPLPQVLDYTQQIASALQYAHDRKLIHRDVKPENMLLNAAGQVVLTDFGIATLAHSTSSMRTQETTGTLAYMAPEQIQGKPRPASDQYALAVTVYQWLTGSLPFRGSSTELIAQHLAVMPAPMSEKAPDIPPEVDQVIRTALAKNPQERFGNVQAFANALSTACGRAPTMISPPPPVPQTQPATPRSIPPTQPAIPMPGARVPVPPTQVASSARETPPPRQLAPAGNMVTPWPQPVKEKVGSKRKKIWLAAALLAMLVVVGAIILIPAILPHANASPYITSCVVGSGYNSTTGKVVGESNHFSSGAQVTLVCQIAPGTSPNNITDSLFQGSNSSTVVNTGNGPDGYNDTIHNVHLDDAAVYTGSYTWGVFYNQKQAVVSEVLVNFQVT